MGRVYTVSFSAQAQTAQVDFFEFVAASGKPLRLLALMLSQTTELGDAQEEQLLISIKAGQTTSGSGGGTPTPIPLNVTDAAAGFTAETCNTTKASAGTIVTHFVDAWNIRAPYQMWFPDKLQIELTGGRRMTVELGTTPADSITFNGTAYVEELG